MRNKSIFAIIIAVVMMLAFHNIINDTVDGNSVESIKSAVGTSQKVYLYGEAHGVEKIMDKEFELWKGYYNNQEMRHLFIELPYYTTEYLNLWMKSDNDDILDAIYEDWSGTALEKPYVKVFYKNIKSECPETVFHGTDVGHGYSTTGKRYLNYLQNNNLEDSEQYKLTLEAIEQGEAFHKESDYVYRENAMVENFMREFEKLSSQSIMGIYGADHTGLDKMDITNTVPCMANQLNDSYGDIIISEDISWMIKDIEPLRIDALKINEKEYQALYYGEADMTGFKDFSSRKFWRLENAFDDFKDYSKTGDILPSSNYPMLIENEQVMVIDYIKIDGSVVREYYISDGVVADDMLMTETIIVE